MNNQANLTSEDRSCVSGTVFGRLPSRYNIGRSSGRSNYTDIMTIPASVARKAYQDAARGNNSEFFYVRRWRSTNGAPDEFVAVTCRLSSGGARVPFSITNVKLLVAGDKPAPAVVTGATLPQFGAQISYNGTGRLKGRWEVVLPGDPLPTQRDLLSAKSNSYTAPPWLKRKTNKLLTWHVQALNLDGSILTESLPQQFQVLGK